MSAEASPIGRLRAGRAQRQPHRLPKKGETGQQSAIRVATYNIHKGVLREYFGLKQIPRIHELRARLHEIDADLIFLQEVQGRHEHNERRFEQWPAEPQHDFLARAAAGADFEFAYGQNATYMHGHHGNALLSRFRILSHEQRDISDHALEKRGLLHCVIRLGQREVHCFVVHFGLFAGSRQRQLEAMIGWIDREVPADSPLIIAGDFNDWRGKLSSELCSTLGVGEVFDDIKAPRRLPQRVANFMSSRLADPLNGGGLGNVPRVRRSIKPARTFPALVPWLRMDRIYQRGFEVAHAKVLSGPTWARLSDHSPLVADLTLR